MLLHETAHADDKERDGRQRLVAQHVVKDRFEPRDDENHQERHDRESEHQHDDRVDHRGDDLVLDLLRFLLEFREPRQHHFEHAAELPGAHHVDIKIVEEAWMLRESFGKGAAALHGIRQFVDRAFEHRIALLFREDAQTAEQRQPGIDQSGELAGENHKHLRLHRFPLEENDVPAAGFSFGARCSGFLPSAFRRDCAGCSFFVNVGRKIARLAQLADRLVGRRGFDQARGFLPARIKSDVAVARHESRPTTIYDRRMTNDGARRRIRFVIPCIRIRVHHFGSGVFQHFLDRGVAGENAAQSVLSQRHHPELDRLLFQRDGRRAFVDQFAERVGDLQQFVDAFAAFVAGLVAGVAALAVVKIPGADVRGGKGRARRAAVSVG